MTTWILLLRGINVGGNNLLPMKNLRALLEKLGYGSVRSYIQSGNCVFECSKKNAGTLSEEIKKALEAEFGLHLNVLVLEAQDFNSTIKDNPYPVPESEGKFVHFFFLAEPATHADLDALNAISKPSEAFTLTDTVVYLHAPEGIGRSKLAANMEKKLGVPTTARNLRTVLQISKLTEAEANK
ncbi:MAG: hypothetical protein COA47_04555 [Robiginitomaculum sp.]|nr:MAG: hypothetical protein COA47_04555 [Robiginitomaculum sp.]